jgi:hypothetical protein
VQGKRGKRQKSLALERGKCIEKKVKNNSALRIFICRSAEN